MYPNRRLELIIRSAAPPTVTINNDVMTISMNGRCIFFLEGTRQKIGVIPFNTVVQINMKTTVGKLIGTVTIQSLDFIQGIDFLGMSVSDLDGLRRTTKSALQNFASSATANGFTLSTASMHSPLRLSHPEVSLLPNALLLQADVDLYRTLYSARKYRKSA